ncbi:MAG: serine/threonine-protein kinase [Planctomycetota bacterium]
MQTCPTAEELDGYVSGQLDREQAAAIHAHLVNCADCGTWVEEARAGQVLLADVCRVIGPIAETPPDSSAAPPRLADSKSAGLPERIGRYRILRRLGAGGMGVVYLAEQEHPRRLVALKVIRPGAASPESLRRFAYESEVLGRLHHPGIAQIYEAGAADTGAGPQPFFALEFVAGQPLTDFARAQRLDVRQRLSLIAAVCDAVEHAHRKGVIHRDLKPANILVDESGQPKILDFGVARATDADVRVTTLQTDVGQLVGTLPYMSPEQVAGDALRLDTRSDVYALGVVLYELLAGHLPHDLAHQTIPEAARIIRDETPQSLGTVHKAFRGDLETIVAAALAKDVERRYASASALAADLRRYLNSEPISARPANAWYQLRKFAGRNRALVGGAATALAFLVVGITGTTWQAVRAMRAEREIRAQRDAALVAREAETTQRQTAEQIQQFLEHMLAAVDPETAEGRDVTVKQVLDQAAAGIGDGLRDRPVVEAAVRDTIGLTYYHLGLDPAAEPHLRRALALREATLGPDHDDTATSLNNLALLVERRGQYAEARALYQRALTIRQKLRGDHPDTALILNNLGLLLHELGDHAAAVDLLRQALRIEQQARGPDDMEVATDTANLAYLLSDLGHYAEAEALYTQALDVIRRHAGDAHPGLGYCLNGLGWLKRLVGDLESAERMLREALRVFEVAFGADHPNLAAVQGNLAVVLRDRGAYDEARRLVEQALAADRRVHGAQHPAVATDLNNLALIIEATGSLDEAENLHRQALAIRRAARGPEHADVAQSLHNLAALLFKKQQYAAAEPLLREALGIREDELGPEHPEVAATLHDLGRVLIAAARPEQAEPLLRRALDIRGRALPPAHWTRFCTMTVLGEALRRQGRLPEAEPLLLSAWEGLSTRPATPPQRVQEALAALVGLYDDWRRPDRAAEWRVRLEPDVAPPQPP